MKKGSIIFVANSWNCAGSDGMEIDSDATGRKKDYLERNDGMRMD